MPTSAIDDPCDAHARSRGGYGVGGEYEAGVGGDNETGHSPESKYDDYYYYYYSYIRACKYIPAAGDATDEERRPRRLRLAGPREISDSFPGFF